MTTTTGRVNGVPATPNTISNLHSSEIDQSREPSSQHTRTQDVGTSYHTFFEASLSNNISPLMQNGDPFSIIMSNSRRPEVQDSNIGPVNSVIWPGILGAHTLSDNGPIHPCSSRSNIDIEGSMPLAINEEGNLHIVKERLQSMVKSHLKRLSQDTDLGNFFFYHLFIMVCHHSLNHYKKSGMAFPRIFMEGTYIVFPLFCFLFIYLNSNFNMSFMY
jgi:hypothetical protein